MLGARSAARCRKSARRKTRATPAPVVRITHEWLPLLRHLERENDARISARACRGVSARQRRDKGLHIAGVNCLHALIRAQLVGVCMQILSGRHVPKLMPGSCWLNNVKYQRPGEQRQVSTTRGNTCYNTLLHMTLGCRVTLLRKDRSTHRKDVFP